MTFTNFYLMRRCLNCMNVVEMDLKRCPQCKYIFLEVASDEEKRVAIEKLVKMQEEKQATKNKRAE